MTSRPGTKRFSTMHTSAINSGEYEKKEKMPLMVCFLSFAFHSVVIAHRLTM